MARLQILELPEGSGDDRPPFVLIVDQMPTDEAEFDALRRDLSDDVAQRIGARAVLAFETTIDIPANDTSGYLPVSEGDVANTGTVVVKIEGDFERFREQIREEIARAQAEAANTLRIGRR